ncbi:MAG: hypothetical protein P8R42_02960 [Candidatus Binatia bacterium]|nr:hypothetical protein [Candidatus Binatia bacterium]
MDWTQIPESENVVELAAVVGEAEFVLEFTEAVRGWFRLSVFCDHRSADPAARYFARAVEKDDPGIQALANASTAEDAATLCIREAGTSLRRARGR